MTNVPLSVISGISPMQTSCSLISLKVNPVVPTFISPQFLAVKKLGINRGPIKHSAPDIHPSPTITSVVVDMGDGPVEVNVDTLQMKILTKLGSVGLDTCADMLHIVDVIQAMNDGKKVIIEESEYEES